MSDTEKVWGNCDSCDFETELTPYPMSYGGRKIKRLCPLCAATPAGNAYEHPQRYPDPAALRTICYVGNVILKTIQGAS